MDQPALRRDLHRLIAESGPDLLRTTAPLISSVSSSPRRSSASPSGSSAGRRRGRHHRLRPRGGVGPDRRDPRLCADAGADGAAAPERALRAQPVYEIVTYRPGAQGARSHRSSGICARRRAANIVHFEWKYERNPYLPGAALIHPRRSRREAVAMRGVFGSCWEMDRAPSASASRASTTSCIAPEHRNRRLLGRRHGGGARRRRRPRATGVRSA